MNQLPTPAPVVTPTTQAFWDATNEGRFMLQRCTACDVVVWFPRNYCPECFSSELSTFDCSGRGTVYSYTVIRKVANSYKEATPFVVAYVELEEGPRVMTNIVDCGPEDVSVGMAVTLVFHDTGVGNALYRFRPTDQ
jgi:uncharacterized OB-fold protein